MHENEHCRAGVSKTKSKIRTSAEANESLQLKSDFVIPKGMTVLGVVIPNGKPANKGFRREDRPDPYSERVEERRCLSDALRDEASEHTPAAGLRGRRLRPARGKRRNGFPNDGVSRLDPAVRKKSGSIPAPRRIPRWTAAPTLRSAAPDRAAEATNCKITRPSGEKSPDRNYRLPHLAASRAERQRPPSTPPHDRCGGDDVPVLVSYGSRGPYGKGSDIAEPKTCT